MGFFRHLWSASRPVIIFGTGSADTYFGGAQKKPRPERDLFEGGPPTALQTSLGLMRPGRPNIIFRACLAVALGWVPLLFLTAVQSSLLSDGSILAFLKDYAVWARSVVCVPLLIMAEAITAPPLSDIARHFRDSGLIGPEDSEAFDRIINSTVRLRDSFRLEIAVATLTAAIIASLIFTLPQNVFSSWHSVGAAGDVSPAGWWHALVSIPILIILLLGWIWRLTLWTRLLYLVSHLNLRLVPSHPDRCGGLLFVGISVQVFCVLALALGMIAAGTIANRVAHDGASLLTFRYVFLGFLVFCLFVFVGPLLVFVGQLLRTWRRGTYEYGALARDVGRNLESKWLNRGMDSDALAANDFSAVTDLYSIVANVYAMNVVPVSVTNMAVLAGGAIVPFIPVVLMAVSPSVILDKLTGVLF